MMAYLTRVRYWSSIRSENQRKLVEVTDMVSRLDFVGLRLFSVDPENAEDHFLRSLLDVTSQVHDNKRLCDKIARTNISHISLSLQWLATVQTKMQKRIIDESQYRSLLDHYYSKAESSREKQFNAVTRFAHTDSPDTLSFIKKNQLKMLQTMIQGEKQVTFNKFESLIQTQLFNITDLPKLLEVLYEGYFPSLQSVQDLKDVRYSLAYLSHFSKMPFFLPRQILELLSRKLSLTAVLGLGDFREMSQIVFMMLFHFGGSLESNGVRKEFEKIYKGMLDRVQVPQGREVVEYIQREGWNLTGGLFGERKEGLAEKKKQIELLLADCQESQCITHILRNNLNEIEKLAENDGKIIRGCRQIQKMLDNLKLSMLSASNPLLQSNIFYSFLRSQQIRQLISQNKLLPNLYRYLSQASTLIKGKATWKASKESQECDRYIMGLKEEIDRVVRQQVGKISMYGRDGGAKQSQLDSIIWSLRDLPIFQHILCQRQSAQKIYQLSVYRQNAAIQVVFMLVNDPQYMFRLIKWNTHRFMTKGLLPSYANKNIQVQEGSFTERGGFKVIRRGVDSRTGQELVQHFRCRSQLARESPSMSKEAKGRQELKGELKSKLTTFRNVASDLNN